MTVVAVADAVQGRVEGRTLEEAWHRLHTNIFTRNTISSSTHRMVEQLERLYRSGWGEANT